MDTSIPLKKVSGDDILSSRQNIENLLRLHKNILELTVSWKVTQEPPYPLIYHVNAKLLKSGELVASGKSLNSNKNQAEREAYCDLFSNYQSQQNLDI